MTTLTIFILPLARSLGSNSLTNHGADMSGLLKLVEVLPQTKIESLECAAAQGLAFVSAPIDTPQHRAPRSHARSLSWNGLGPEGGAALAEGLKGNTTLQSLE